MLNSLLTMRNWSGTGEELADAVTQFEDKFGAVRNRPVSKRTINYYRTKGVIDATTSKKYSYKHLLQCLLARKLSQDGWKIQQIADSVPLLSVEQAEFYLEQPVRFEELLRQVTKTDETEEIGIGDEFINPIKLTDELLAARMLAKGILKQFVKAENNSIVDGTNIPRELRQAMCLLGKLRINDGLIDNCSSVHEVLK